MARLRPRLRTVRGGNGSAQAQARGTPRRLASDGAGAARRGALGAGPFLLRSLGSVLRSTSLPTAIADAIIIRTHIAGQSPDEAPRRDGVRAALIHSVGAHVPKAGMRAIPNLLKQHAEAIGVDIRINTRARRIRIDNRRVVGVETDRGDILPTQWSPTTTGSARIEELVEGVPDSVRRRLRAVPLQSPGLCASHVRASGRLPGQSLRFMLGADRTVTLAVARPGAGQAAGDGDPFPMRLIAPIDHRKASELGSEGGPGCSAK